MRRDLPLAGVRVHLTGSIPPTSTEVEATGIRDFVSKFTAAVMREGAYLVHGSHPTLQEPLKAAADAFVQAQGSREALTLVRAQQYAQTEDELAEIASQRNYAVVHLIPSPPGDPAGTLVPMREWMAERSDVVVAIGGKWYDINKSRAGVPQELEEMLGRGKPGFVVAGYGGAIASYLKDNDSVFSRLRNGLTEATNREIAAFTDADKLTSTIISQLKLLPLVRESLPSGRLFRILTLDGGGIRGAFTAAVLATWDDMLKAGGGRGLVEHFDLVARTSTGAILAIGLGLGLTPKEMLDFYRAQGPKIFPKDRSLRHWLRSKHESSTLRAILEEVFRDRTLTGNSQCRLVIPTVRAAHGETEVIVTAHGRDRTAFHGITAVDAALASSAAPTYFDEAVVDGDIAIQQYLDGGIWANNPVLPAVAEAVRYLRVPIDRLDVLSVGTTGAESDFTDCLRKGKAGWAPSSADLFFAAQEHAATVIADSLLTRARHLRVNQQTRCAIPLDDAEAISEMTQRGNDVGKDSFAAVRSRFLDGFHAPPWREDSL